MNESYGLLQNSAHPFMTPIITQEEFPFVYQLITPSVQESYSYSLPSTMLPSVDPAYVTGPQKYEYRYVNDNGIDVVIRGTYVDVMSTVDVLTMHQPIKKPCDELQKDGSNIIKKLQPKIQKINKGDFSYLNINGKIYSGSGIMIMIVESGDPNVKFVMFRDSKTKLYQETGGKIDKIPRNAVINEDTLFDNAAKETLEESVKLFDVKTKSKYFVDVESTTDNTFYRVYLYLLEINDIKRLPALYAENRHVMLEKYPEGYTESFMETDKLDLIDYIKFMKQHDYYDMDAKNISKGIFQGLYGESINVRGRTINAISQLKIHNVFQTIMSDNAVTKVAIKKTPSTINTIIV